jgi:hypothetical protein
MPRRSDSLDGYWISPHPGLSGYPKKPGEQRPAASALKSLGERLAARITIPAALQTEDIREETRRAQELPKVARLIFRDRLGFRYERIVGLLNLVSNHEAAYLLGVSLMSVSRWVRSGKLPSRKRKAKNGKKYSVVKVADVWRLARELNLPLPSGRTFTIVGAAADGGDLPRPQKGK